MIDARKALWLSMIVGCFAFVGGFLTGACDFTPAPEVPVVVVPVKPKATHAVYIYEKDDGGIPAAVAVGIDKLNRDGIVATMYERNSTDGTNEVPEQYKAALAAAYEAKLPALVVSGGGEVLKVVSDPQTTEQVTEAVR